MRGAFVTSNQWVGAVTLKEGNPVFDKIKAINAAGIRYGYEYMVEGPRTFCSKKLLRYAI